MAVPTVGLLTTLVVAAIPLVLAHFAPDYSGLALALSFALWLATASAVAWGALRLASGMTRARVRTGSMALGADGFAVRRWWRTRFTGWKQVDQIELVASTREVALELADGRVERLLVSDPNALRDQLVQAKRRFDAATRTSDVHALRCEGTPGSAWVERAKALTRAPGYRDEAVSEDELLSVLEDAGQSPEQRVGAMLALSTSTPATLQRVRVAIDETVAPDLAEALEQASAGDVEPRALRRALRR